MANKDLKLPRVLLECVRGFRFVATRELEDGDVGENNDVQRVLVTDGVSVVVVSEKKSTDTLGEERWNSCDYSQAEVHYFSDTLQAALENVTVPTRKTILTKPAKTVK